MVLINLIILTNLINKSYIYIFYISYIPNLESVNWGNDHNCDCHPCPNLVQKIDILAQKIDTPVQTLSRSYQKNEHIRKLWKILILSWTWNTSKYPIYRKLQEYTGSKWSQKGYKQIIIMIPGSSKCVKFVILWFLCLFIWKTYINLPKNKYFKYLEIWNIWVYKCI